MDFGAFDIFTFVLFIAIVIGVSLYASRKEETTEDYFLAGRGLSWWLIGMSLIASNISSEHFIGMAGKGYSLGLAIASYEWMAAVTLTIVGLFFLPKFLRAGIYTIPQFLEYRYNSAARLMMAVAMLFFYVLVTLATVLYSGALALNKIFDVDMTLGIWIIGILAGGYTVYGGLKAVVWSDLIQASALLIGGLVVTWLGMEKIGGLDKFMKLAGDKMHTVLPADHPEMPWVAVFIGGLWIPNLFYWGLNQFITQRTLAAKNLEEGQKGILFGATLKLLIPFIVVFPGIMAYELYGDQNLGDGAYPHLIKNLLPSGMVGFMFAALFGAVMSTLDSLLNSSSTIFTIDIYKKYIRPESSPKNLVKVGRIATLVLMIAGCFWAPVVGGFESLYDYIQKFWGFIQSGILAAFLFGLLWKKVPPGAAIGGMIVNVIVYGLCLAYDETLPAGEKIAFLHYMGITFLFVSAFIIAYTLWKPLQKPVVLPEVQKIEYKASPLVIVWSILVVVATAALYIYFR